MAGNEEIDIPGTGAVFTFGRSRFADNVPSHFFVRNDPIIEIACGDEHTAVVCQKGRVFMFGNNDYGQLGLGHKNVTTKPSCVKILKPEKAVHVACGRAHTIVSTESGKLFAYGSNSDGQLGVGDNIDRAVPTQVLDYEGDEVQQISAGCLHTVVLTESGHIYVWGSNSDGQLGLENKEECVLFPKMLPFEHKVRKISCGYYHTAIVTDEGDLYTCGEGENGKLGLPDSVTDSTTPTHVVMGEPIMSVACGGNHTLALTTSGRVYAFGSNSHGQLGVGTEIQQSILPAIVDYLSDYNITNVFCGENHSAFIADHAHLYMSGDGKYGKICNDDIDEKDSYLPFLVPRFNGYIVQKVACGGCHTMILARVNKDERPELDEPSSPYNNERESAHSSRFSHLLSINNNKELSECYDETSTQVEHGSIQSIDMNGNEEHSSLKSRMDNEEEKSLLSVPGQPSGHRSNGDPEALEQILVDKSDNEDDDVAIEPEEKKQGRMQRFFSAFRRNKHSSATSSRSTKRQASIDDIDNDNKSRELSGNSRNKTPNTEKKVEKISTVGKTFPF